MWDYLEEILFLMDMEFWKYSIQFHFSNPSKNTTEIAEKYQ